MPQDHWFFIWRLIEGALNNDKEKVYAYSQHLAELFEREGDSTKAKRLRQLLHRGDVRKMALAAAGQSSTINGLSRLPVDSESRLPVADELHPVEGDIHLVLPEVTRLVVERFLDYFKAAEKLIANGVGVSPTMLIYGAPGTGKTLLAQHVAARLHLPLLVSRADGLISSYLGSTAKNVRLLFEHAASRPCVLFLDEFDALAKKRDDSRELGELKRVVIGLLQNIDAIAKDHVLIAATNHEHLLDPAIWRRFTYKVELTIPGEKERSEMLRLFLGSFASNDDVETAAALSEGLTGAHLRDVADESIREAVLANVESIKPDVLVESILVAVGVRDFASLSVDDKVRAIASRNPQRFTQKRLASLFGISQPQISRYLSQTE